MLFLSVKCTFAAMRNAKHFHSLNYAKRFLTGLNENFLVVKSQILLMDPLPSLNKIFSMVIQHERQGKFVVEDDSKAISIARLYRLFLNSRSASFKLLST